MIKLSSSLGLFLFILYCLCIRNNLHNLATLLLWKMLFFDLQILRIFYLIACVLIYTLFLCFLLIYHSQRRRNDFYLCFLFSEFFSKYLFFFSNLWHLFNLCWSRVYPVNLKCFLSTRGLQLRNHFDKSYKTTWIYEIYIEQVHTLKCL